MDLSALSPITTAASSLSGLILVSPQKTIGYQPQNAPSWKNDTSRLSPALLFNYEGEQSVSMQSDITDHFIENNTVIQDQIGLRPVRVTVHGFIGELNDIAPAALQPLKTLAEKLVSIGAYTPQLSVTALLAYNEAQFLYSTAATFANSAVATWSTITGGGGESVINGSGVQSQPNQNKQQLYFQQFYGYWSNRTLFTVQTPWAVFQDMAIESWRAIQDADTRVISDFEITFKLMRFAATSLASTGLYDNNNFQGRASSQGADEVDQGTSTLKPASLPFGSALGSVA